MKKDVVLHTYLPISKKDFRVKCDEYKTKGIDIRLGIWEENEKGCRIEFTVGDATLKFATTELVAIFSELKSNNK